MPTPPIRDARGREVAVDERLVEANRLEDLRAAVTLQRRDPHLRHHFQDALVQSLDVARHGVRVRDALEHVLTDEIVEALERQVRIDRPGAVPNQQRDVMHFTRVAGLDHQRAARPRAFAYQVMVHAGGGQEAGDRRELPADAAVRQDQNVVPGFDGLAGLETQLIQRRRQPRASFFGPVQHLERDRAEPGDLDVAELRELVVVDDRIRDANLPARRRFRLQEVALRRLVPEGRRSRSPARWRTERVRERSRVRDRRDRLPGPAPGRPPPAPLRGAGASRARPRTGARPRRRLAGRGRGRRAPRRRRAGWRGPSGRGSTWPGPRRR